MGCWPKELSSEEHSSSYKLLPAFFWSAFHSRRFKPSFFTRFISFPRWISGSGRLVCSLIPSECVQRVDHLTSYPATPRVPCGPILPGAPCRERIISPGAVSVSVSTMKRIFSAYGAYRGSDGSPGTLGSDVARLALPPHGPRLAQRALGALASLEREQRSRRTVRAQTLRLLRTTPKKNLTMKGFPLLRALRFVFFVLTPP